MSSRKSSASCVRNTNLEDTPTGDCVIFPGTRVVRPERQPHLPPVPDRQKDEGFARFLKKHSSPTHNRVTAGGRIVPMEPRSPPTFALAASVTNRTGAAATNHQNQEQKHDGRTEWAADVQPGRYQGPGHFIQTTADPPLFGATGYSADSTNILGAATFDAPGFSNSYDPRMTPSGVSPMMPTTSLSGPSYGSQAFGGHDLAQPAQNPLYSVSAFPYGVHPNLGMGVSLADHYHDTLAWQMQHQQYTQPYALQPVISPQQMLAAWEQHYHELDDQLKNIDRHRAMNSLDPALAEQRRVIVQQRSDAKDTIREYQALLGHKRVPDSSQGSLANSFNFDHPVYIPTKYPVPETRAPTHSSQGMSSMVHIEKPRGKAIPIKPPPEALDRANDDAPVAGEEVSRMDECEHQGNGTQPASPAAPNHNGDLATLPMNAQFNAGTPLSDVGAGDSTSQLSGPSSSDDDEEEKPVTLIVPPNDHPPVDLQDEYVEVFRALCRPKGTISQVRVLDGAVMNVEGQNLDPRSFPAAATTMQRNSPHQKGQGGFNTSATSLQSGNNSFAALTRPSSNSTYAGKENFIVGPVGHQKAATDAFVAQFNAVDQNMATSFNTETKSLRAGTNGYGLAGMVSSNRTSFDWAERRHDVSQISTFVPADVLNYKCFSSVGVQNIHAVGSPPNNFDGSIEARQSVEAQLASVNKTKSPKSPKLLRQTGGNRGAWYGPYCRDVFERALRPNNNTRPARLYFS